MRPLLADTGVQSALHLAGHDAASIGALWWIFLAVCTVVYIAVLIALALALVRRRREDDALADRAATRTVSAASALSLVTLCALLVVSILTGRELVARTNPAVTVEVTGRQWWWQFDYDHPDKSKRFTTANELYLPAGRDVEVRLRTSDVIHSFWVPPLHGKRDLITGKKTTIVLHADRPGVYRGQCAEFCGVQHANMAFWVTALPPAEFEAWSEQQRAASRMPSTPAQRRGLETFVSLPCALCHSIAGTEASGKTGPDLTHFASRRSIGAATLPNRRDTLARWLVATQHVKPGSYMPEIRLRDSELADLVEYLESLR